jgi:NAD(P)-dependent dehydrogenase (short-subunit alcohol dehydrogenase family)
MAENGDGPYHFAPRKNGLRPNPDGTSGYRRLGYIGSHACVALAAAGRRQLVILDNLSNSKGSALERIRELAPGATIEFVRADVATGCARRTAEWSSDRCQYCTSPG